MTTTLCQARCVLGVGDRVLLTGGSDAAPAWLHGRKAVEGTIERFIPGHNRELAAVVRLDEALPMSEGSGDIAILELRHVGATWQDDAAVHVELCDFEPEGRSWANRRRGEWVEAHATCHRARQDDKLTAVERGPSEKTTESKGPREAPARYYPSPQVSPPSRYRPRRRYGLVIFGLALVALVAAYVSLSDSVEYLHIGTNACLVTHTGWHFHVDCRSVSPPKP
jgi:hypothetical protein